MFILLSGLASGVAYGAGSCHRHIGPLLRDVLSPAPAVVTIGAMALVGAALGMALTSAAAPAGFLASAWGGRWMAVVARTERPWLFRLRVAGFAVLPVAVTVVLVGQAFVFR
jgi:hypothetical protein